MTECLQKLLVEVEGELEKCVDFWIKNGIDEEHGGMFNLLDRKGKVYDSRKNSWLLGRAVWTLCQLYCDVPKYHTDIVLNTARSSMNFMEKFMKVPDNSGRVFFAVSQDGKPIAIQRKLFSEVFFCLGMVGMARASEERIYLEKATEILKQLHEWSFGSGEELGLPVSVLGRHNVRGNIGVPIMILGVATEAMKVINTLFPDMKSNLDEIREIADAGMLDVQKHLKWSDFYQRKTIVENIGPDGEEMDSIEGHFMIPGHAIELGWFIFDFVEQTSCSSSPAKHNKDALIKFALDYCIDTSFELAWDKEHEGIYYFLDNRGYDPEALEWNMKLWWPHCEALVAFLQAYRITNEDEYLNKFNLVWKYSLKTFSDSEFGEWFGNCDRFGNVTKTQKGGQYKGFFHVPRCLLMCRNEIRRIMAEKANA